MAEKTKQVVINDKLHRRVHIHCAEQGISIKEFVEAVLRSALDGHASPTETISPPPKVYSSSDNGW